MNIFKIIAIAYIAFFSGCLKRPHGLYNTNTTHTNSAIVERAMKYIGKPYRYGHIGPDSFDCSGFVYAVTKEVGISIPRTSIAQSKIKGKKLSRDELREGDLLFFDTSLKGHVNHSGIYIGKDRFIHASSGKAHSVTISTLNGWYRDKFRWGKRVK